MTENCTHSDQINIRTDDGIRNQQLTILFRFLSKYDDDMLMIVKQIDFTFYD